MENNGTEVEVASEIVGLLDTLILETSYVLYFEVLEFICINIYLSVSPTDIADISQKFNEFFIHIGEKNDFFSR